MGILNGVFATYGYLIHIEDIHARYWVLYYSMKSWFVVTCCVKAIHNATFKVRNEDVHFA